jgi:hypothetical protein
MGGPALAKVAAGASAEASGERGGWGVSRAIPPQSF